MSSRIDRRQFLAASGATAGVAAVMPRLVSAKTSRVGLTGLKVDYLDRPLGLENPQPLFSWRLESSERNVRQKAYRVLVASGEDLLKAGRGDLWDSGRIESGESFGIRYRGRQLSSRQRCWWSVQIWDEQGIASPLSAASSWEMGLLDRSDWSAQWLAVEDSIAAADRAAGLRWIWGEASQGDASRKFRHRFHLSVASKAGALFVDCATNQSQVTGIWIDGIPVKQGEAINLMGEWLAVQPLDAGEHLIAVEVNAGADKSADSDNGMVVFARFDLASAQTARIGTRPDWKCAQVSDDQWHSPIYDDREWGPAREVSALERQPWPAMPAMHLRREFHSEGRIVKARLYATALGVYEAYINGQRVGEALLAPEISQYARRILYRTYDVTELLKAGTNALGLTVGDGWYASWEGAYVWGPPPRRVMAQLALTLEDGSRQVIATGPGWRIAPSPIRRAEIRRGERYDARLAQSRWSDPGFDDLRWEEAKTGSVPSGKLVAQVSPPIRATQLFKAQAISEPKPNIYVVDFGQNFAGWCRLRVQGERGMRIELKFAEELASSGEIDQISMGIDLAMGPHRLHPKTDIFVLSGDPHGEVLEPSFTYRGFRYVQISGLRSAPQPDSIEGVVIHSDLPMTGSLKVDSALIQRIWHTTLWTQRSNFVGIQTDCPSREQRGWLGDAGIFWDTAAFNMDVSAFTARTLDAWTDDQFPSGAFPLVSPHPSNQSPVDTGATPAWADAGIILPWTAWQHYGDTSLIERHWAAMDRYIHFIRDANPDFIWRNKRANDWIGDWLAVNGDFPIDGNKPLPTTASDLLGTAYWAYSTGLLAQMAQAIGRMEDAARLRALFEDIRRAFNTQFVKPDGTVGSGSQASYVLALKFDLLSPEVARQATERLVSDIRARADALTTGIVTTQFILDVLADAGFPELSYSLLLRTDYPSWGYMIGSGATTIWENWRNAPPVVARSSNHPAFGAVCSFLYRRVAGIEPTSPGFKTIRIRPVLDPRVRRAGGHYDSVLGRIATDWSQNADGSFTLNVRIPPNSVAHVCLPAASNDRIHESRRAISSRKDLRLIDRCDEQAIIEVGSGSYHFLVGA